MGGMDALTKQRFSAFRPPKRPAFTLDPVKHPTHLKLLERAQPYDAMWRSYLARNEYEDKCVTDLLKGRYLGVVSGWGHNNKVYRERPLEVWPRGVLTPRDRGNDHANHRILRSTLEYHFARFPAEVTKLPTETFVLSNTRSLTPDNTWCVRYQLVSDATMYFHEEDDTGSERVRGNKTFEAKKKTLRTMFQNYVTYFESGPQFPTVSVLIHTTKANRVETILGLILEEVPEKWRKRFAVKAVPDFIEEPLLLPTPDQNLIVTDYTRIVGDERQTFNIMDTLKATELRKRGERS